MTWRLLSLRLHWYHQQYLAKNPNGYRCHSNTGAKFPS
jgi:peptide methionine sulfoxide reductase MsrA